MDTINIVMPHISYFDWDHEAAIASFKTWVKPYKGIGLYKQLTGSYNKHIYNTDFKIDILRDALNTFYDSRNRSSP